MFDLPVLTQQQIDKIKAFVQSLQWMYFKLVAQKSAVIAAYLEILGMVPMEAFWEEMAAGNIPRDHPADFDQKSAWEQILWIRTYGIPTAWKIIEKLENRDGIE